MTRHYENKLKYILREWIPGTVAVLPWFQKFGGYRQLLKDYEKNGWITSIGRGAYIRQGDDVDWTGALYAVQYQLSQSVFIGGKTALEIKGYGHNIPLGKGRRVTLLSYENRRPPSWFLKKHWDVSIDYIVLNLFPGNPTLALTEKEIDRHKVRLSSPERAILEVMALVPDYYSFESAMHLMESLMTPRIEFLEGLLKECRSVKAKRLFAYFADLCEMPWASKIGWEQVDFGKGARQLCKGGKYIDKFEITVPKYLVKISLEDIP